MFVIELNYIQPLKIIDAHMQEHIKFLDKYYASGNFLMSGRKVPRSGGIIIATGKTKKEMEKIIKADPFYKLGLAEFTITEFNASQRAQNVDDLIIDQ